jgi:hypothetical protein
MKTKFFAIAAMTALSALAGVLVPSTAVQAADFEFDSNLAGDGEVNWNFDFAETEDWSSQAGAEFNFNGGAGTNGEALAKGAFTGVGGVFYEYAGGDGTAYSHTNGTNAAEAEFSAGSFGINGGFAADLNFGDPSKISHSGVITAGGAGSVETGLTTGTEYAYSQTGGGAYDFEFNNSGYYED